MISTLCVIIPVFNDWPSLSILLDRLNEAAGVLKTKLFVTVVDDGSTDPMTGIAETCSRLNSLIGVEVIHLALNVGHQRAIAIGLCVAVEDHNLDCVLVMDGDGEDPPEHLALLLERAANREDFCFVAQRRKRTEKISFKLSYLLYKSAFRLLTGKTIDFGNFSLTSRGYARRLVMVSELWNNTAAAVLRSRLPFERVPLDRGHRYKGSSKMNFVSLIIHGLSGISVYAETIMVRLLILAIVLFSATVFSVALVLFLRFFFPAHATPGWATTVSFGMAIILTQVLSSTLLSILALLNSRAQVLIIPIREFRNYVGDRHLLTGHLPSDMDISKAPYFTT